MYQVNRKIAISAEPRPGREGHLIEPDDQARIVLRGRGFRRAGVSRIHNIVSIILLTLAYLSRRIAYIDSRIWHGINSPNSNCRSCRPLWDNGKASIREIQETFPAADRPAYTTIQDNCLPSGSEERCASCKKDQQRTYFRGGCLPQCCTNATNRRPARFIRRANAADHGASDRVRQTHHGRRKRS